MAVPRDRDDRKYFADVQEILRTGRRTKLGRGEAKLMFFVLDGSGADLEITDRAFTIRFDWNSSRHRYFMDLAPGVVSALLDWCDAPTLTEAYAARFRAQRVPRIGHLRMSRARFDRDVWFLPGTALRILVRRAELGKPPPSAAAPPIPICDPPRMVRLTKPHACPHCGHGSSAYRNLVNAWVCNACARSFPVGPAELTDVVELVDASLPNSGVQH